MRSQCSDQDDQDKGNHACQDKTVQGTDGNIRKLVIDTGK